MLPEKLLEQFQQPVAESITSSDQIQGCREKPPKPIT